MHIFLQGPRNIGKSTIIRNAVEILMADTPLSFGGFFTWKGRKSDPNAYIKSARAGREEEIFQIASFDPMIGRLVSHIQVFESEGARMINDSADADIIIMDELGFLESEASGFIRAVYETLGGSIPVLGVLRADDIFWLNEIRRNPRVSLFDVDEKNRDSLPREIASHMKGVLR